MSDRPNNVKLITGIYSDEDWELAVDSTELMSGWPDWIFGWLPGMRYQLWLTRTYAFARGMQTANERAFDRLPKPEAADE